jgi:hypothetical protein
MADTKKTTGATNGFAIFKHRIKWTDTHLSFELIQADTKNKQNFFMRLLFMRRYSIRESSSIIFIKRIFVCTLQSLSLHSLCQSPVPDNFIRRIEHQLFADSINPQSSRIAISRRNRKQ